MAFSCLFLSPKFSDWKSEISQWYFSFLRRKYPEFSATLIPIPKALKSRRTLINLGLVLGLGFRPRLGIVRLGFRNSTRTWGCTDIFRLLWSEEVRSRAKKRKRSRITMWIWGMRFGLWERNFLSCFTESSASTFTGFVFVLLCVFNILQLLFVWLLRNVGRLKESWWILCSLLFWFRLNLRTLSIDQFKMFDFVVFRTFSLVAKKVQKRKEELVRGEFWVNQKFKCFRYFGTSEYEYKKPLLQICNCELEIRCLFFYLVIMLPPIEGQV